MADAPSNPPSAPSTKSMDDIMALCKRRGFVYQASEIYGGINGFWDYGPLGAQLKKNLREAWWQDMIMNPCWGRKGPNGERVRCVPVETRIIQHPKVWEASGHAAGFNDPMVDDKETKQRFRADHLYGIWADTQEMIRDWKALIQKHPELKLFTNHKPRATVIAASLDDAARQVESNPKLIKPFRIEGPFQPLDLPGKPSMRIAYAVDPTGNGTNCIIESVTHEEQRTDHENLASPFTGKTGVLTEPRAFNLMFISYVGAVFNEDNKVFLRPETAQGIFVQFKNVVDTTRVKVPFGIGNTGTSFRNEITPRNFTFRSREFDQAELEFFCHPDESQDWYKFWRDFRMEWWQSIGLRGENLILREHAKDELSHYSQGTSDVEYRFPFTAPGFGELEGIAHRGCFDLTQHAKFSGVKLDYFDQERGEKLPNGSTKGERYIPHCIEPAAGLDRGVLAILCEGYTKDASRPSPEIMRFHPRIAPIKAAIFPLVNKDGMPEVAEKLYDEVAVKFGKSGFIETDPKQSIGKRYARMDEAGCPFCFTIDGDTLTNQSVTVRDRDTGNQERIAINKVSEFLSSKLGV
jgi:glycyl-tRNA synthetase